MAESTESTESTLSTERSEPLLRIHEVAAELGMTTRAIRYYEEVGLLEPAARSDGDYRLYDPSDVERLRFIKGLRDDAGFSLTQIGQMLEDEAARERNRERLRRTTDPDARHRYFAEALERIDRQISLLEDKARRIDAMIADARSRRDHIEDHLAGIEHDHPRDHDHAREDRPVVQRARDARRPSRARGVRT